MGYWIAERFDGDEVIACWTTQRPGSTGPYNLQEVLAELIWNGWNVRHVATEAA